MTFVKIMKHISIDIDADFDEHKEILSKYTSVSCSRYEPMLELDYKNKHGTNRYVKLKYNRNKQLQSIKYWDVNPKYNSDDCYYTHRPISLGDKYIYIRSFLSRMIHGSVNEVEL